MDRYRVVFLKALCDDSGHERDICQGVVELRAADPSAAERRAKRCFGRREGVADWSFRADRVEIARLAPEECPTRRMLGRRREA